MSNQSDHDPTRPLSRFDLPRLVRVRESSAGYSLCYFHGWTKVIRCAVGDGSAIFTPTEAIIERIHNGEVFYTEPHKLQFCNPNANADLPPRSAPESNSGTVGG